MTNIFFRDGNGPLFMIGLLPLAMALVGGNLAAFEAAILTGPEDIGQPERVKALSMFVLGVGTMLGGSIAAGRTFERARK